jgi:hypothetical protein
LIGLIVAIDLKGPTAQIESTEQTGENVLTELTVVIVGIGRERGPSARNRVRRPTESSRRLDLTTVAQAKLANGKSTAFGENGEIPEVGLRHRRMA